jgi:hypothetical protein
MELAGLEPATSWVRFHLLDLPCFAILRHFMRSCGSLQKLLRHRSPSFAAA